MLCSHMCEVPLLAAALKLKLIFAKLSASAISSALCSISPISPPSNSVWRRWSFLVVISWEFQEYQEEVRKKCLWCLVFISCLQKWQDSKKNYPTYTQNKKKLLNYASQTILFDWGIDRNRMTLFCINLPVFFSNDCFLFLATKCAEHSSDCRQSVSQIWEEIDRHISD